ncbi:lmo0937 family membrane protein [Paenibacillus sp. 1P07SE]
MLWAIFVLLLIFWGVGFAIDLMGGLIHILLVFALIALIFNLVRGRRGGV